MTVAQVENLSWFLAGDYFHLAKYFGIWFFAPHFTGDEKVMKYLIDLQISKHCAETGIIVGKNREFIATLSQCFQGIRCTFSQFPAIPPGKKIPQIFE